jgi:diaminopimelate decarboxylase
VPLPACYPRGSRTDDGGDLVVGGCSVAELCREFGTPVYVYDEADLRSRAREYRAEFEGRHGNSEVLFASKAFPCTAAYRLFAEEGLSCDVASRGELFLALQGGMDPARIYLHGNAKDDADVGAAVDAGVGCVVIDSFDDIDRLERLAGDRQRVFLRVNPEVEADTHEAVLTGHSGSKFGLRREPARRAIERLRGSNRLELTGLHVHVGSQILALEPFARALDSLAGLGEFAEYDLGGGLGIPYRSEDSAPTVGAYAETLTAAVRRQLGEDVRLLVEPGRSLVGNAGVTAYRVVSVKRDAVVHVAVDGGMGDNLEPSLYGTAFEARLLCTREQSERCQVVGKHCESGDVIARGCELPEPRPGDLLAVAATGAYCYSLASNYNQLGRPPLVAVRNGTATPWLRRETFDDLRSLEVDEADSREEPG